MTDREETQQVAFRLPVSLLKRLNAYAQRIEAEHPGIGLTRADVARMLLVRALDAAEPEKARTAAKTKKK